MYSTLAKANEMSWTASNKYDNNDLFLNCTILNQAEVDNSYIIIIFLNYNVCRLKWLKLWKTRFYFLTASAGRF